MAGKMAEAYSNLGVGVSLLMANPFNATDLFLYTL